MRETRATCECHRFESRACSSGSADGLDEFWLASIVPLCNLFAGVTEQVGGSLNAGFVAADFAAKIMLGKTLFDVRIFQQSCHETLPHRIPSSRLAAFFVEIAFALARAKKPGGEINRARGLGLFYGLFERRSPFKDASSARKETVVPYAAAGETSRAIRLALLISATRRS